MANDLVTTEAGELSPETTEAISRIPAREVALLTDIFHNAIVDEGRASLALPKLPTPQEKRTLEKRRAAVIGFLRGHDMSNAGKDRVTAALNALFGSYFNHKAGEEDIAGLMVLMRDRPAWAIEEVCQDIFDGRIFDVRRGERVKLSPDFLPSGPRLNQCAIDKCIKLEAELFKLKRVLSVTRRMPPSAASHAKPLREDVFTEVRDDGSVLTNDFAAFDAARTLARKAQDYQTQASVNERMRLAEYTALGIDPIRGRDGSVISVSLARSVGRLPPARPPQNDDGRRE